MAQIVSADWVVVLTPSIQFGGTGTHLPAFAQPSETRNLWVKCAMVDEQIPSSPDDERAWLHRSRKCCQLPSRVVGRSSSPPQHPPSSRYTFSKGVNMPKTRKPPVCHKCGLPIAFERKDGKFWPVNPDGSSHWDLCKETRNAGADWEKIQRNHKGNQRGPITGALYVPTDEIGVPW